MQESIFISSGQSVEIYINFIGVQSVVMQRGVYLNSSLCGCQNYFLFGVDLVSHTNNAVLSRYLILPIYFDNLRPE